MRIASSAIAVAVLTSGLVPALAATRTTTFAVTATVQNSCLASASGVTPGSYVGAWTNAASPVSVTCRSPEPYNLSVNVVSVSVKSASVYTLPAQIPTTQILPGASPVVSSHALLMGSAPAINLGRTADAGPVAAYSSGASQPFAYGGQGGWAQYLVPGADTLIITVTY